jgi:hypothetical protein
VYIREAWSTLDLNLNAEALSAALVRGVAHALPAAVRPVLMRRSLIEIHSSTPHWQFD